MPRALIIDDDRNTLVSLGDLVRREGFDTALASDLAEARAELDRQHADVILCDLVLPDGHGTDLLAELEGDPTTEFIIVTANATLSSAIEALRRGAYDYLTKPVDLKRLTSLIGQIKKTLGLKSEVRSLRHELRDLGRFGKMVGRSEPMQRLYDRIERVAPTNATVLITGESGSGKELVAETIHVLSSRSDARFLPINCGAVSPQLIESELFGHEKGSFTGADRQHRGIFEQADGGTLFLDEITETPADLQVKLLRVLETGAITRVGGGKEIEVDVRVIAATNREPQPAVDEGRLREDLFFRLNVFRLDVPPLRDRAEDIELLANHFLDALTGDREISGFTPAAVEALKGSLWRGNVRELRNVVEHAMIMAPDNGVIDVAQLPNELQGCGGSSGGRVLAPVGMPLETLIESHTRATLAHFEGNKSKTAEALGISLKTLYNRLERWEQGTDD